MAQANLDLLFELFELIGQVGLGLVVDPVNSVEQELIRKRHENEVAGLLVLVFMRLVESKQPANEVCRKWVLP